jgi:hypothetical protein
MRYPRRDVVEALRASAAQRSMRVRALRMEARSMLAEHRAARQATAPGRRLPADPAAGPAPPARTEPAGTLGSVWDLCAAADAAPDLLSEPLAVAILDVIARCPDGAAARDIGNALGVDWRRVVGVADRLIDAGLMEQIGPTLYNGVQARRTC